MRITSKGQVTIPIEIREKAGLLPNTEVEFILKGKTIQIVRAKKQAGTSRGDRLVRGLRGQADAKLSTDAIMALTRSK